jgi:hypothetical protein
VVVCGVTREGRADVAVGVSVMVGAVRRRLCEVGEAGSGWKSSSDDSSCVVALPFDLAGRFLLDAFSLPFPFVLTPASTSTSTISSSSFFSTIRGGVPIPSIGATVLRTVPPPKPNPLRKPPGLIMPPCTSVRPSFSRLSRHGLQICHVQPGHRIMSMLRLSHSLHLAVRTVTMVMSAGSIVQMCSVPPGVRREGLAMELSGVRGGMGVRGAEDELEDDFEAPEVAGGGMQVLAWSGGDGVFAGDDMVVGDSCGQVRSRMHRQLQYIC